MTNLFFDVSEDTIITGIWDKSGRATFFHGGKKIGETKDREFSKRLFDIWVGDEASNRKFQRKLVGKSF